MTFDQIEMLISFIRDDSEILEAEKTTLSRILSFHFDFSSHWDEIHAFYAERIAHIEELLERNNDAIRFLRDMKSVYFECERMNAGPPTSLLRIAELFDDANQQDQKAEGSNPLSDSEGFSDKNVPATSENTKAEGSNDSAPTSDPSKEPSVAKQDQDELRRKQLADALISQGSDTASPAEKSSQRPSTVPSTSNHPTPIDSSQGAIQVPPGKLAGGHGFCRSCGASLPQDAKYCPICGTKVILEDPAVAIDKVQFSAVVPKTFVKGDYSILEIYMYEEAFRHVVEEAIENADTPVKETKSGILPAEREAKITITLFSPDIDIEDNTESQTWSGEYLNFSFAVEVPEHYSKRQILFVAAVYINDVIATRLKFVAKCQSLVEQKIEMSREDVLSAFVSYASQDRNRVAMIVQGMQKARPDMDIFFDVNSLRSGDDWESALQHEIDKRDVLYLCWSINARNSKWVDAEWRYALRNKGADSIEPVPIDPPGVCPPPVELSRKHFNDKLLYIIHSNLPQ